ncbi:MAG: hypothetical protein H8D97_00590 [Proteobacteria bacterium]|nr:hypothetical protein [Pseudomonadota bacterium]
MNNDILENINRLILEMSSPKELLKFMKDIKYGLVTTDNKRLYSSDLEKLDSSAVDWWKDGINIKLLTTDEVLKFKIGSCYDQSLLEYKYLKQMGYIVKFVFIEPIITDEGSSHSAVFYKENKQWFWFEHSWGPMKGIHGPFKTIDQGILKLESLMKKSDPNVSKYYINKDMNVNNILDKHNLTYKDFLNEARVIK